MKSLLIVIGLVLPVGLAMAQNSQPSGSGTQSQSKQSASAKTDDRKGNPADLKTQNYTGVLVDASCGAGGSAVTSSNTTPSSPGKNPSRGNPSAADRSSSGAPSTDKAGEASRTEQASTNCAASAKTTAFGLRMKDGHVMRFDAVGNERAIETFSAKKKWADASAAGKEIQATVNGTESGDTLTVLSIR